MYNRLSALSPLDGRYGDSIKDLAAYFSEAALMRYRLYVEIEYLIALSHEKQIKDLPTSVSYTHLTLPTILLV